MTGPGVANIRVICSSHPGDEWWRAPIAEHYLEPPRNETELGFNTSPTSHLVYANQVVAAERGHLVGFRGHRKYWNHNPGRKGPCPAAPMEQSQTE